MTAADYTTALISLAGQFAPLLLAFAGLVFALRLVEWVVGSFRSVVR